MAKRYYIAYGSNLNIRQMQIRCPGARAIGTSKLEDFRLMFKGSRSGFYLTVEPEEGCSVPVAVWEVTAADERALDRYEGFPGLYRKKEFVLHVKDTESGKVRRRTVFAYIMHDGQPFGIPSHRYMETCAEGYRDFGFDIEALLEAFAFSQKKVGVHG